MPVDLSAPARESGPPALAWLATVNRHSLAVRLLATTVHECNNILQVMSGAAEVLALDPTPAAIARRTTSIVGQSAAATAVLHDLIAFVRAEHPAQDGARPLALAQQALAFRQHAFRKLHLAAAAEGDDVECGMARHRLQQVLLNLVVNAEQALTGWPNGTECRIGLSRNHGISCSDCRAGSAQSSLPAVRIDQRICIEREVSCIARGRKMIPDPFHDRF